MAEPDPEPEESQAGFNLIDVDLGAVPEEEPEEEEPEEEPEYIMHPDLLKEGLLQYEKDLKVEQAKATAKPIVTTTSKKSLPGVSTFYFSIFSSEARKLLCDVGDNGYGEHLQDGSESFVGTSTFDLSL